MTDQIVHTKGGTLFAGKKAVDIYTMSALAVALEMYDKSRIFPNERMRPRRMMDAAQKWTGKKFKPRDYWGAAQALREKVMFEKREIEHIDKTGEA